MSNEKRWERWFPDFLKAMLKDRFNEIKYVCFKGQGVEFAFKNGETFVYLLGREEDSSKVLVTVFKVLVDIAKEREREP